MKTQLANTSQIGQFYNNIIARFSDEEAAQQTLIFKLFQNVRPSNSTLDARMTRCNTLSKERNAANLAILEDLSSEHLLAI